MLFQAASHNALKTMELLIKHGSNVNIHNANEGKHTALWQSVKMSEPDAVNLLLRSGADPNDVADGVRSIHFLRGFFCFNTLNCFCSIPRHSIMLSSKTRTSKKCP